MSSEPDDFFSHLRPFVVAKAELNGIFESLGSQLRKLETFERSLLTEGTLLDVKQDDLNLVALKEQVTSIKDITSRDKMKVAFFGRTSNGKSTVINSILNESILPSGIGQTTSCFVTMEGTTSKEPYILAPNSTEKKSVADLNQLAFALNHDRLDCSSAVQLYWPLDRCQVLENDVIFVDSPGVDVTPDTDGWIEKYCKDADVFILVANAESTLNHTEKQFFHRVNKLVSKPNIFILNNRWDASALEPKFMDLVRTQHIETGVRFLTDDLNCVSKNDAHDRIFFVSAREVILTRTATPLQDLTWLKATPGYQDRLDEFIRFENTFQKCLSESAIVTKFQRPSNSGITILDQVIKFLESEEKRLGTIREESKSKLTELSSYIKKCQNDKKVGLDRLKAHVKKASEEAFTQVYCSLVHELETMSAIMKTFTRPFYDDAELMVNYKHDLIDFVEKGIERNAYLNIRTKIEKEYKDILKNIVEFIEEIDSSKNYKSTHMCLFEEIRTDFNFEMDLNNLCEDFFADVTFRFSLSPSAILRLLFSVFGSDGKETCKNKIVRSDSKVRRSVTSEKESKKLLRMHNRAENGLVIDDAMNPAMIQAIGLMTSTTSGLLIISVGMAWKFIGQRFILAVSALYSGIYVLERVSWTNGAKERSFKKQLHSFMSKKLTYSFKLISSNYGNALERDLKSKLLGAKEAVERVITRDTALMEELELKIKQCDTLLGEIVHLKEDFLSIRKNLHLFGIKWGLKM